MVIFWCFGVFIENGVITQPFVAFLVNFFIIYMLPSSPEFVRINYILSKVISKKYFCTFSNSIAFYKSFKFFFVRMFENCESFESSLL